MKKKGTLTLKQLEKAYQKAKAFDTSENVYPDWKYWIYKFQFWKYKEIMKGVFVVK